MKLVRTKFAYDETMSHLAGMDHNPLINSYLVQYLIVSFYSEMEEKVREIIQDRISNINDRKLSSFIIKSNEGMMKRVKKAEINDVLNKFDCGEGDVISQILDGMNLQPYFDMITNRHRISHRDGAAVTLEYFGQALPCGEAVLEALENALAAE